MYTILPIIIPIAENDSIVESGLHGVEYIIIIESRTITNGAHPAAFFNILFAFITSSASDHLQACRAEGCSGPDIFIRPALGVSGSRSGAGSVQADSAQGADQPVIRVEAEVGGAARDHSIVLSGLYSSCAAIASFTVGAAA